jgi:serine/threonine protein kinase
LVDDQHVSEIELPDLIEGCVVISRFAGRHVLLAVDDDGAAVTIKRLPRSGVSFAALQEALSRLRGAACPQLPPLLRVVQTEDGERHLIARYVPGEDMRTRLSGGPLGAHEALRVTSGAAQALAVLHARGFTHGDVKPANLVVAGAGDWENRVRRPLCVFGGEIPAASSAARAA